VVRESGEPPNWRNPAMAAISRNSLADLQCWSGKPVNQNIVRGAKKGLPSARSGDQVSIPEQGAHSNRYSPSMGFYQRASILSEGAATSASCMGCVIWR